MTGDFGIATQMVARPVVEALQALRGINLVTAATVMAEIGDLRRFENRAN